MWYYNSVVNNNTNIMITRRCRKGSTPFPGISASHALEKIKCIVFFFNRSKEGQTQTKKWRKKLWQENVW